MELGLGFCVDARALVLVGLGHGPILLRRLPVGDRVDEVTSKQASSTASALVSSACHLTVVSWLTYPFEYIIKNVGLATMYVAEAVFVWAIAAENSRIEEEVALVNPCGLATRRP